MSAVMERARRAILDNADELNRLDAVAGDGDLGVSAVRACAALAEALDQSPGASIDECMRLLGITVARVAPSTAGTLVASGFLEAARTLKHDPPADDAVFATVLSALVTGIAARGKARAGDKTLLDALIPAADAARAHPDGVSASISAAHAATTGADATRSMEPKFGRAAWTPERSAGSPDAGATLVAIVLRAVADELSS